MDAKKSKTIFRLFAALLAAVVSFQMMSTPVYAATTWNLEGWRVDSTIWIKGNLFTWYEGENVPMRLKATGFEATGQTIAVSHDYQDADGAIGIDEAFGWFIGPIVPDSTPIEEVPVLFSPGSETFTISGPALIDTSNGKMIEYQLVPNTTSSFLDDLEAQESWAIYWKVHMSRTGTMNHYSGTTVEYGSGYFSGNSLHSHTSVTGSQDVPIGTRYALDLITIPVVKTWNGPAAAEATIRLWADGVMTDMSLVLNSGNSYTGAFIDLHENDENGHMIAYTITEDPITGYTTEITGSAATGFTVVNSVDHGTLKVIKVDQFENKIPGAVFEISPTSDFTTYETLGTTDSNGEILDANLEIGTYYVREASVPAGYIKSDEVKQAVITKNTTTQLTFTNTAVGSLKVIKVDQFDNKIPGAVFEISPTSDFTTYETLGTTDVNGEILEADLPTGTYYVREASVPAGYVKSDEVKQAVISKNTTTQLTFTNTSVGLLKIIKVDQFENRIPGAVFEISPTSDFSTYETLGTTDANGEILEADLEVGTYYVREASVPAGYVKSDDVKEAIIAKNTTTQLTFSNTTVGSLKIIKVDQFDARIPGAVFEISPTRDFTTFETLGTTDANGEILEADLPIGTYYVREASVPAGYVKSDEVKEAVITKNTTTEVTFTNTEVGSLKIIKVDQFGARIPGAVFEFSPTQDFETHETLGTTDVNGEILAANIATGTYYVREVSVPAGYVKSEEVKETVITKDATAELTFENEKLPTLRIVKKDTSTLANLAGIVFGIYTDAACTDLVNDTEYTTDANGVIEVILDAGVYYIRENHTIAGYTVDPTPYEVTITDGVLEEVTIFNAADETEEEEEPATGTHDFQILFLGLFLLLAGIFLFTAYRAEGKKS